MAGYRQVPALLSAFDTCWLRLQVIEPGLSCSQPDAVGPGHGGAWCRCGGSCMPLTSRRGGYGDGVVCSQGQVLGASSNPGWWDASRGSGLAADVWRLIHHVLLRMDGHN